jgi:hypothetical protein
VADQVTLTRDGIFHYADRSKNVVGHGPVMDLAGVSFRQICEDDVATGPPPPSFCTEPMQFAANFSYDAPLANQVLTRGFSFHTDFLPSEDAFPQQTREAIVATIRTGFGTALTNWFSGLLQRRSNYDPRLQAFIDTLVSRSPAGFAMLIPPQVVALKCPQAATFIVRIYANHDGPFAADKERKAAYASKPGRTLVLNFSDYPCWNQGYFKYVFDATSRCINIDSILTHELGHAFGLDHVREADSIMTQFIQVTKPSDRDVDRLAAQLLLTVQGGAPGSIVFTTDNGVAVEEQR